MSRCARCSARECICVGVEEGERLRAEVEQLKGELSTTTALLTEAGQLLADARRQIERSELAAVWFADEAATALDRASRLHARLIREGLEP